MVFHWSLIDSKSPQVSMTPLSILAGLTNAVVRMVSILPLISKQSDGVAPVMLELWVMQSTTSLPLLPIVARSVVK